MEYVFEIAPGTLHADGHTPGWQGGRGDVPWTLVEQDCLQQNYFLVERKRLPPGVTVVRQSHQWSTNETLAWLKHLTDGDSGKLENDAVFQWLQTAPDVYHFEYSTSIAEGVIMRFEPDSIAFAWRVSEERASRNMREDHLPPVPLQPYVPLNPETIEYIHDNLPTSTVTELLADLAEYETLGPYQVSLAMAFICTELTVWLLP